MLLNASACRSDSRPLTEAALDELLEGRTELASAASPALMSGEI